MNRFAAQDQKTDPVAWWNTFTAQVAAKAVAYGEALAADVIACLRTGAVNPMAVAGQIYAFLRTAPALAGIAAAADAHDTVKVAGFAQSGAIVAALDNDLSHFLLANFIVPSPGWELILTQARRALLLRFADDTGANDATRDFLAALAQHCFLTEYAYWEEPDETVWAEVLSASAEAMAGDADADTDVALALLACYRPLLPWPGEQPVSRDMVRAPRASFDEMWKRLVDDPTTEIALRSTFPTIGAIEDLTSQTVREMYEENPYPRWRLPFLPPTLDALTAVHQMFPAADLSIYPGGAKPRVLVAGCGTGFMANCFAKLFAGSASLMGIDLSRASLAHAARQSRDLALAIDYAQADILALPDSFGPFDVIECSGVLHHTKQPQTAWRSLCDKLAPGGLMKIALYNRNGRDWVSVPRQMARTGGYKTTARDLRRFRRDVTRAAFHPGALPRSLQGIFSRHDFYSLSMCRDACFHQQEEEYALRQITSMAEGLGLSFLGISFLTEATLLNYQRQFPSDPFARNVRFIEMYEELEKDAAGSMYTLLFQKPL